MGDILYMLTIIWVVTSKTVKQNGTIKKDSINYDWGFGVEVVLKGASWGSNSLSRTLEDN